MEGLPGLDRELTPDSLKSITNRKRWKHGKRKLQLGAKLGENETFGKLYKGNGTIISVESEYNNKLFNPKYREGDEIIGFRQIIDLELTDN